MQGLGSVRSDKSLGPNSERTLYILYAERATAYWNPILFRLNIFVIMTNFDDPEKAVDGIVGGSAPDMLKTEYGVGDGEDPEITSSTTDGTNNRLMRLKDEYGVRYCSYSINPC